MAAVQLVVAVGQDDQRRRAANPPAQIFEQIERRRIGPVHVLEDEHGRLLGALQLMQESGEDREPVSCRSHQLQQLAIRLKRDIVERPSGCGVNSASHRPSSVRASARCAARKASTRAVLPMPASPYTKVMRPSPAAASRREFGETP